MRVYETAEAALARFAQTDVSVAAAAGALPPALLSRGLVNRTYVVGSGPDFALQAVAPAFDETSFARIDPVAAELDRAGIAAPHLIPAPDGTLALPAPDGWRWRLLAWVSGEVFELPPSPAYAHGGGDLLGRFHDALWQTGAGAALPLSAFHDTDAYMVRLSLTLTAADPEVVDTARTILDFWNEWQNPAHDTAPRPGHGDLKLSNFVFAPGRPEATGIVDFDTLGQYGAGEEFGDAARSWCNRASEDEPAADFNVAVFAALAEGYLDAAGSLTTAERGGLVYGAGRITAELAARFCIDATEGAYFFWDAARAPDARTHNLWRARGQLSLARQIAARRDELEQIIG
jgi:aminoglycoside phosphotransferase (APT) family kinase protein